MRLKNLFTVPAGQKVTEKHLRRVLISSICSILLCMSCLVSTTWAWFAVSIENTGNIIEIATVTTNVDISADSASVASREDGSYVLAAGDYSISVGLEQPDKTPADANLLNASQCPVYVIMTVRQEQNVEFRLFTFTDRESKQNLRLAVGGSSAAVSFSVSWVKPAFDIPDGSEPMVIGELPTEPATEPSTQGATAPSTEPSAETTAPATEPSSEPATEPSAETTVPPATQAPTVPSATESFTEETTSPAAEETTIPTETESATVPNDTGTAPTADPQETTTPAETG